MTPQKAREALKVWAELGAKDPDALKRLLVSRSLKPAQALALQGVLDAVAAAGGAYTGVFVLLFVCAYITRCALHACACAPPPKSSAFLHAASNPFLPPQTHTHKHTTTPQKKQTLQKGHMFASADLPGGILLSFVAYTFAMWYAIQVRAVVREAASLRERR
jgi:hypothetical protein